VTSRSIPDSGSPLSCQLTFSHYIYVFINFSILSNSEEELRYEEHMGFQVIKKKMGGKKTGKIPTMLWW